MPFRKKNKSKTVKGTTKPALGSKKDQENKRVRKRLRDFSKGFRRGK
jgi:hypothetical protein